MARLVSALLLSALLIGCAADVYVPDGPPAPQVEVSGVAPYPGAVWIGGYWGWEGGRHVWRAGRWERGRPGYVYEPHRWERRPRGYVMVRGRWRR